MSKIFFVDFKKKQVDRVEVRPDKPKVEMPMPGVCSTIPDVFAGVFVASANTINMQTKLEWEDKPEGR